MKKIGLLSLALVLALGALGVGYAAWTDQITIEGTVNTGSVEISVEALSGTEVYKVPEHDIVVRYYGTDTTGGHIWESVTQPAVGELIASATTSYSEPDGDKTITVTFDNLFPSIDFMADVLLHYTGSVPAIVDIELTSAEPGEGVDPEAWAKLVNSAEFVAVRWDAKNHESIGEPLTEPIQLHNCDYVKIFLVVHLDQDPDLMNLNGSFTAEITAIQWNEYGLE